MHTVRRLTRTVLVLLFVAALAGPAFAQAAEHAQPAAEHAQPDAHATEGEHAEDAAHEASITDLFWPVVNFAILCGVLYYFLKTPLSTYLKDRGDTIRRDLVEAAGLKSTATAQLAEIDRKLQALPGEISALRSRGQAEVAAEEQRIAQQATAERDRLLEQAKRDIDMQVRLAKRELTEHAADLSMQLATDRLTKETTPADHARLVDRYLEQVKR
jgi:F-type H+-transporting ATPase subunit b